MVTKKGAIMEIQINNKTYRVISNRIISESEIKKIEDAIRLKESQKTSPRIKPKKKFCVAFRK